jgi:regulator of replication initiation timing
MSILPSSKPSGQQARHVSAGLWWFSQGILLAVTAGGMLLILNRVQRHQEQLNGVSDRLHRVEQSVVQLTAEMDTLRTELGNRITEVTASCSEPTASTRRLRQPRSETAGSATAGEQKVAAPRSALSKTKRSTSGRSSKTQALNSSDDSSAGAESSSSARSSGGPGPEKA